jgi:serine/threonine-protein kinase
LNAVIAEYLQAAEAGRAPDRREFLERHWDLTDGLLSFFANEDSLKRRAGLPRAAVGIDPRARSLAGHGGRAADLSSRRGFGEFELLNEIASGGMGIVYKARHKRLNRIVALKTIEPGAPRPSADLVRRLRMEASVVAALDHPNIVPLYEIGEQGGYPYLVLKLVPCGDLERHAPRFFRNPRAAARLVARVARTVHYAHRQGILHCDLKPSNILLDPRGVPHVTDFGLAKCVGTETGLTRTGLALGTPAYMAPEQILGCRPEMTVAVDVYGLGAVLYKLLTGRPPFHEPEPLGEYNPRVDSELEAICLKCLEVDPERRYPSASALAAELESWSAHTRGSVRRLRRSERAARRRDQNRMAIALSAGIVALATIFALTAVATATIICHYELAELAARPARQARVEINANAAAPAAQSFPVPLTPTGRTARGERARQAGRGYVE